MTTKVFNLVKGIITGCEAIAVAVVSYCCEPGIAAIVTSSVVIACGAAIEICGKFVKD